MGASAVGRMTENGKGEALRCKMEEEGGGGEERAVHTKNTMGKQSLVIYESRADTNRQSRFIWIN